MGASQTLPGGLLDADVVQEGGDHRVVPQVVDGAEGGVMRDRAGLGDDLRAGDEGDAFAGLVHGQPLVVLDVHDQRAGFVVWQAAR